MNFISRFRIKRNPNIIDSFKRERIPEEMMEFAISNGYQFKPEYLQRYFDSEFYSQTFKLRPEFIQYAKNRTKELHTDDALKIYSKDERIYIIKNDERFFETIMKSFGTKYTILCKKQNSFFSNQTRKLKWRFQNRSR